MTRTSRIIVALASLLLLALYVAPLWRIELIAPQYPEGLGLRIWVDRITGLKPNDLNSINGLNHYIGMRPIDPDAFPELRLMPRLVAAAVVMGLLVALAGRRPLLYAWAGLFTLGAIAGLGDFWKWGYQYGHRLDPHAAIKVPGMAYQPPLLGTKQLLNFTAHSWPDVGGVLMGVAFALGALTLSLLMGMEATTFTPRWKYLVAFGIPALAAFAFSRQPVRYGLSIGAVLLVSTTFGGSRGHVIHSDRTFFGVHRVVIDPGESYRQLLHGSTIHGLQSLDPARRREPLGYFSANGPAGQILGSSVRRPARIAVVGLGNGTLATYALPGESWTFFELDAAVERIARDPRWFTFLRDSPGSIQVVLGDGRLSLSSARDRYDLLILDAYSSEAIPLHLMSREALALYVARIEPRGVLALHISNRHFDLAPIVAALAQDAGLEWRVRRDEMRDPNEARRGNVPSTWAVLTHRLESIATLAADPRWRKVRPSAGHVWTDDYSSLLSALR